MILESEEGVHVVDKSGHPHDLLLDLIRSHEDMGVILIKAPHSHKAVELT